MRILAHAIYYSCLIPCYLWVAPWTLLGIAIGLIGWFSGLQFSGVQFEVRFGTIGIYGPGVAKILSRAPIAGGARAMTLGHCILTVDELAYYETMPHEWVHVRQYQWFGPFFVPAYLLESAWQWMRGGDSYLDNRFEKQAYYWQAFPPARIAAKPPHKAMMDA